MNKYPYVSVGTGDTGETYYMIPDEHSTKNEFLESWTVIKMPRSAADDPLTSMEERMLYWYNEAMRLRKELEEWEGGPE